MSPKSASEFLAPFVTKCSLIPEGKPDSRSSTPQKPHARLPLSPNESLIRPPPVSAPAEGGSKKRRSTRKSGVSSKTPGDVPAQDKENSGEEPENRRRSTRRSVAMEVPSDAQDNETTTAEVSGSRRRSSHRSVAAEISTDTLDKQDNSAAEGGSSRRRSTRRSVAASDVSSGEASAEAMDTTHGEAPSSRGRSTRRSLKADDVAAAAELPGDEPLTEETAMDTSSSLAPAAALSLSTMTFERTFLSPVPEASPDDSPSATPGSKRKAGDGEVMGNASKKMKTPLQTPAKTPGVDFLPPLGSAPRSSYRRSRPAVTPRMIAKAKSPEEVIQLLSKSPMIELKRKTPKLKRRSSKVTPPSPLPPAVSPSGEELDLSGLLYCDEGDSAFHSPPDAKPAPFPATGPIPLELPDAELPAPSDKSSKARRSGVTPATALFDSGTGHDVPYFRQLLRDQTARLQGLCDAWSSEDTGPGLSEEASGAIRAAVGKAHLLMRQRFKQFSGLVDNCEFGTGEKLTTPQDLDGFWDMIYFQVEDVDNLFTQLGEQKKNGWVSDASAPAQAKPKAKKTVAPTAKKPKAGGGGKTSKFAAFRAQMKAKKDAESKKAEEEKTFKGGFFAVTSPVGKSKPKGAVSVVTEPFTPIGVPQAYAPSPLAGSSASVSVVRTPGSSVKFVTRRSLLISSEASARKTPAPKPSGESNHAQDVKTSSRRSLRLAAQTPAKSPAKIEEPDDFMSKYLESTVLLSPSQRVNEGASDDDLFPDTPSPGHTPPSSRKTGGKSRRKSSRSEVAPTAALQQLSLASPAGEEGSRRRSTRRSARVSLLYTPPPVTASRTTATIVEEPPTDTLVSFSP